MADKKTPGNGLPFDRNKSALSRGVVPRTGIESFMPDTKVGITKKVTPSIKTPKPPMTQGTSRTRKSTMSNDDYLAFCRNELKRSKRWRSNKTHQYDDEWRRYIDLYKGKHYDAKNETDQLTVNMIFATINVMAPAVAINNPKFIVNARKPESAPQAIITEEVLNYMWRTHQYQDEFRLSVLDWLLVGHGWLKVGYKWVKDSDGDEEDDKAEGGSESNVEVAEDMSTEGPEREGFNEGIADREPKEGNVESELNIADDRPFLERISPFDMYVDPDARHPKEMRWVAQRTWRSVADVHVDERYSATFRKRVSGSSWSRWDNDDADARPTDERPDSGAVQYCEIIEFYDIKRGEVCTFATSSDATGGNAGFLIKPEDMPYAAGHPFVMLRNYEVPDHFYPMGDVCQIESLQLELNETRNQMLNYRKKYRRGWLYAKDRFSRDGIAALQSDEDNVMVPVEGDNNPESAITPIPAVITPPEFFDQSAMITNDLDRVSGVSDYQRGAQSAIKRTATEAGMIQDAANARAQDRLAKIESILAEVGARVVGLMQQYLTGDHMARIVTMPVRGWFPYDAERIKGQFDFEVYGGSTEPQNETFRRQAAMQLADISAMFIPTGVVNEAALWQEILQKGFGFQDTARLVKAPPPPPMPGPEQAPPGMGGQPPGLQAQQPPMPPMELTPEILAQMMGAQGGAPPPQMQGPPPEMMGLPPEMMGAF
jgi:hypothetical protein